MSSPGDDQTNLGKGTKWAPIKVPFLLLDQSENEAESDMFWLRFGT